MATDKIQTGLRLPSELLRKITFIAKHEKRSLNAQLEYATQQCVDEYELKHGVIHLEQSSE